MFLQENNLHDLDIKAASMLSEKSLKLILSRVAKVSRNNYQHLWDIVILSQCPQLVDFSQLNLHSNKVIIIIIIIIIITIFVLC